MVEPSTVVREHAAMWARPEINLSELARLRFVEGWSIPRLQAYFGAGRTKIKDELKSLRPAPLKISVYKQPVISNTCSGF